jgi:hypothetical protein
MWSGERASRYLWKCQHYLGRVDMWSGERTSRYLGKCQHYLGQNFVLAEGTLFARVRYN